MQATVLTTDAMAVDGRGSTGETTATGGLPADIDGRSAVDSLAPICEFAECNEMPNRLSTKNGGTVDELTDGKLAEICESAADLTVVVGS